MRKILLFIFSCYFISSVNAQTTINIGTTVLEASTIYTSTSTNLPWELKYGPGDSLWMTTRQGRVFRIHPVNGGATLLLDHSASIWQVSESGMLGMTFHPNFSITPHVFIVYTYTSGGLNRERLSRFTYSGNSLTGEAVLIDGGNINAASIHNGSRLLILPDNTILMTTGDAANTSNSQNLAQLNGKILRANLDGSIPANNPFPGSYVYSFGHRNPQGLALHPNGRVFQSEHGPGNNDEFQEIISARNYGWPNVEGYCDNDINGNELTFCESNNVKEPLVSWNPAPGGTWAPNDLIWYSHPSIPEFQNSFLVTFLKQSKLRKVTLNTAQDAVTGQQDFFVNQWGRLRDITVAPNGDLYLATNTSPFRIIRLRNPAYGPVPVVLSDYKSACSQNKQVVKWTTEYESNSKHFILNRSTDGINFHQIAVIPSASANGNSNLPLAYSYIDNNSPAVKAFYKLISVDLNGRSQEHGIVSSSCGSGILFTISPNPASDWTELKWAGAEKLKVKVYNALGQQLFQTIGVSGLKLPVYKWPADMYVVTVTDENNNNLFRGKLMVRK